MQGGWPRLNRVAHKVRIVGGAVSSGRLAHRGARRASRARDYIAGTGCKSLGITIMNSPQVLLDRLDRLLAEVPASPCYAEDLNDPDYTLQHEQFDQVSDKSLL